jgi:hypothetical protein
LRFKIHKTVGFINPTSSVFSVLIKKVVYVGLFLILKEKCRIRKPPSPDGLSDMGGVGTSPHRLLFNYQQLSRMSGPSGLGLFRS